MDGVHGGYSVLWLVLPVRNHALERRMLFSRVWWTYIRKIQGLSCLQRRVMGYKEKTCPKCNSKHNKRGEFCSRSCGNSRPLTKEQKQKIGAAKSAWLTGGSEEAEVAVHNFVSGGNNKTAEPIAPIVPRDAGYGRYVEDGDLWEEV